MNRLIQARVLVAVIAIVVWGYGYSVENERITLAGIALLAISLVLRFFGPRPPRRDSAT